jgi:hypothetical protein
LLRDEDIWLHVAPGVTEAHFPQLFEFAWSELPEDARQAILRQWRALLREKPDRWLVGLTDQLDQRPETREYGMCEQDTGRMFFQASAMLGLDPPVAICIIVHELAHAFLLASGSPDAGNEEVVDRLAHSWGFPMAGIRRKLAGM